MTDNNNFPGRVYRKCAEMGMDKWKARAEGLRRRIDRGGSLGWFAPEAINAGDLHPGGEEVLVLEGTLEDEHGTYPTGTWLHQPDGSSHSPYSKAGCTLWVKRGHLPPVEGELAPPPSR